MCFTLIPAIPRDKKKSLEVIVIHDIDKPRSEKKALIILPGLGDSKKGRKAQKSYFENIGYDLFIPDYIDRDSYEGTILKFSSFYDNQHLNEYREVHVFSYILGTWVINNYISTHGRKNFTSIVYDRSPLQERAPRVIAEKIPGIGKMAAGPVVLDFNGRQYPPMVSAEINAGIIVESKATLLIRFFKKTTKSYGPIDWENLNYNQKHKDLIFSRLTHKEIYTRFDVIGPDIIHFFKNGSFTKDAKRDAFDWDPYEKYKEK